MTHLLLSVPTMAADYTKIPQAMIAKLRRMLSLPDALM
jgi:hypothetical protein